MSDVQDQVRQKNRQLEQFLSSHGQDHNAFSSRELEWIGKALNVSDTIIVGSGMRAVIETVNDWLDGQVAEPYKDQPLAQDWARVAKLAEETGEAVSALIACTGQNPRKSFSGTQDEMLSELADAVCTGLFALQHFTDDAELTADIVEASLIKALNRATGAQNAPGYTTGATSTPGGTTGVVREAASETCPLGHVKPVAGCDWCEVNIDPITWRQRWAQGAEA